MINIYSFLSKRELIDRNGDKENYIIYVEDKNNERLLYENVDYDYVFYFLIDKIRKNLLIKDQISKYEEELYKYKSFHLLNVEIEDKLYTIEAKE